MFAKRYITVSIVEATIKVAQVSSAGAVEKIAKAEASGTTPEELLKALTALLSGFNCRLQAICAIPAALATAKNIEVPSGDPQEIRSIINLQAGRHTPYSREEILVGNVTIGSYQPNHTKVLLVIAHRNIIKERLSLLQKAGLNVEHVIFVPEAIAKVYAKSINPKRSLSPIGILDIGQQASSFLVVARGTVIVCRSIPVGIKTIEAQGEAATKKFIEELTKSLVTYKDEDIDKSPDLFYLTGNQPVVKDLQPILTEALKVPVEIKPYAQFIKVPASLQNKMKVPFAEASFLDVVAPALMANKLQVNLIPDEILVQKNVEQQSREATKAGMLALIVLFLVGAVIISKIYFKDVFLNKNLKAEYAQDHQQVKNLQDRMAKTKTIREYLTGRLQGLDAFRELSRLTPNQIYLTNVSLDDDGTMTIEGVSDSMSLVFSYVSALGESALFSNVKTKSTAAKKERDKDVAAFVILLQLQPKTDGGNR